MQPKPVKGVGRARRLGQRKGFRSDAETERNLNVIRKHLWAAMGLQYFPPESEAIRWAAKVAAEFVERALFKNQVADEIRKELQDYERAYTVGIQDATSVSAGSAVCGEQLRLERHETEGGGGAGVDEQ